MFLFSICFLISFQSSPEKVNQIRNIVVCVATYLVFLFYCALTTGRCTVFQHIGNPIIVISYDCALNFIKARWTDMRHFLRSK